MSTLQDFALPGLGYMICCPLSSCTRDTLAGGDKTSTRHQLPWEEEHFCLCRGDTGMHQPNNWTRLCLQINSENSTLSDGTKERLLRVNSAGNSSPSLTSFTRAELLCSALSWDHVPPGTTISWRSALLFFLWTCIKLSPLGCLWIMHNNRWAAASAKGAQGAHGWAPPALRDRNNSRSLRKDSDC